MSWIKKILATPYLKSLIPSDNWTWFLFTAAAILVCLLIYLIVKRLLQAKEPKAEIKQKDAESLDPGSLRQVWKTFLKNIPAQFRRSILMYQPYIVMGEAGTGKSNLIDNYTDWKNQANQFYPSHTQDPLIQIYLASRIIVQEIPAVLLHDTSAAARKALLNLWKCFKRKKNVTVVIALKGETLINGDPDSLKEQAQMIRGKINILSQILKRPLNVRIAVTFMNHVKGFTEFSAFMEQNNIPLELVMDNSNDLNDLEDFITPYEEYLSNALISQTSKDYLRLLSFCHDAPVWLSGLSRFIQLFQYPDPLSASPEVTTVFFTADRPAEDKPRSNPFVPAVSVKKVRSYNPFTKHRVAAAVLLIAGISYLMFSYQYKQKHFSSLFSTLDTINGTTIETHGTDLEIHEQIQALLDGFETASGKVIKDRFLVDFFPGAKKKIHEKIIRGRIILKEKIVRTVFKPKLTPLTLQGDADKKNLTLLALIYASNSNGIGSLIKDNMEFWVTASSIPQPIIERFISISDTTWNQVIPLADLIKIDQPFFPNGHRSWLLLLNNIKKFQKKAFINPNTLSKLQRDAIAHMDELDNSLRSDWFDKIKAHLNSGTVLSGHILLEPNGRMVEKMAYTPFRRFLDFFWKLKIEFPRVENMNLEQLFENLGVMARINPMATEQFQFEVDGEKFSFHSGELHDLVTKSSMVMFVRSFVSYFSRYPGFSFFQPGTEYENLVVNVSSDQNFYFSKRDTIDGRYSKEVYEKEVMPVLNALPDLLKKLPVGKGTKTHLANFIYREVEAYAHQYLQGYENYYKGFRIDADSVGEIRYILTQMTLPLNQFQEFLMFLHENLSLEYGDNPYFALIKSKFRHLKFISLLMQNQKDEFPELEKYKGILQQILGDLMTGDPVPENEENDLAVLKGMLPAEARIGLDIFMDGPDSYLRMIRKWGRGVGIPEQWLYPFTEPVYQIYLLSQEKIEQRIGSEWNRLDTRYISPVMDKFPFNPESLVPATPDAIKNMTWSSGEFWTAFSKTLAPLCRKSSDGRWQERFFVMSSLTYPSGMFEQVNHIKGLSTVFFTREGEPKPLAFEVKPFPLPKAEKKLMYVVLSYIRSGNSTVFGFNQKPTWHKFNLEWWKKQGASVGVEFREDKKGAGKIFTNISVPNSFWSFHRLLGKAAGTPEPMTWMWDVESPGKIQWKRAVSFSVRQDPWAVFQKVEMN